MVEKFHTKIVQVQALQLVDGSHPGEGTAQEMAKWCGGKASWEYDAQREVLASTVTFGAGTIIASQWLVKRSTGDFIVMDNDQFKSVYQACPSIPTETCPHCLADMNNTQFSDQAKKCPNCQSGYVGKGRGPEYQILYDAGAVRLHG